MTGGQGSEKSIVGQEAGCPVRVGFTEKLTTAQRLARGAGVDRTDTRRFWKVQERQRGQRGQGAVREGHSGRRGGQRLTRRATSRVDLGGHMQGWGALL